MKITLYLAGSRSLKDKRRIVKSLIDQIRSRFNVAIAEVADQDKLQLAVLGIACVSGSAHFAGQLLDKVLQLVASRADAELVGQEDY